MTSTDSHHPLYPTTAQPTDKFRSLPLDNPSSYPHLPRHDSEPTSPLSPQSYGYGEGYPAYSTPPLGHAPSAVSAPKEERATNASYGARPAGYREPERRGRWSSFWATYRTRNQIIFLSLIVLQALVVLAMIALVYGTVRHATGDITTLETLNNDPELESVATYLGLFILAVVFELGITLDALKQKNLMTLVVLCAFQAAMLVYSAVLPTQLKNALTGSTADTDSVQRLTHAYAIVIPCIVGFCTLAMTGMLYPLRAELTWDVFKKIGADLRIRRYYATYLTFVCLLKFDFFFFVGFALQFLILVSGTPTVEFVLTIVALPVTIVALALFAVVVRIESRTGVYASFVVQAAGMAYFVWKLVRIYQRSSSDRYSPAKATLTIFSIISFLMLVATFVMMGLCYSNFDKGLRERIPGYDFHHPFTRPSLQPRQPSNQFDRPFSIEDEAEAGAGGPEKRPGLAMAGGRTASGRNTSGYGTERTQTRMSID
ncbi:hypothetical protein JCM8097_006028 [Rhodosporidiobolus ruineniae]